MDINVYREFAEIVLQGSYSAAAKALNLSQPTLSRHVSALEKELNAKLVEGVLPVRLTPAGDAVFQAALSLNDLYTGMQDDLAELRRAAPARIRLHDTPALRPLSARIVAAANDALRTSRGAAVEYVAPRTGKTPKQAVTEGLCDFSFVQLVEDDNAEGEDTRRGEGAPRFEAGDVRAKPIPRASDRLLFALPKTDAAAKLPETNLASLRHETFFLPAHKSSEPFKAAFAEACRQRGFRPLLKMIPCERCEEFYLLDHGDGVHVVAEGDLVDDPSLARQLEQRAALVPAAASDGLRIRWHVLYRDPAPGEVFTRFLSSLTKPWPAASPLAETRGPGNH